MTEFRVLQQLEDTAGKNDKIAILKNNDSLRLRKLLWLTYNKFITFRVKQIDHPVLHNAVQPDIFDELVELCELLSRHTTGSNDAKAMLRRLLSKCTEENAKWVARIVTRDLKIGIDEKSINKAFPGLVPVFDCQLAYPMYSKGKNPKNYWPTLRYPVIFEEKLDGVRVIAVVKDGKVTFFSRAGFDDEYDEHGVIAAEILKLRPGTDFVLDGEMIAKKFNPDNKTALKHKDSPRWPFEQAKSMLKNGATTAAEIKEYIGYYVWDIIELDFFESQGVRGKAVPAWKRKAQLTALFERHESVTFANMYLVPNVMARSEAEIKAMFRVIRDKGGDVRSAIDKKGNEVTYTIPKGEGGMVKETEDPYEFKRSAAILKVKEFYTADLRIVGAYEGKPDTKFVGMLGGVNLASDCGKYTTDCGSGFDEDQRFELWMMHQRGELAGKIVEVSYQEITADGSLCFPVYQGIRSDKNTTNVEDGGTVEEACTGN